MKRRSAAKRPVLVGALAAVLLIAAADLRAGADLRLSIFYLIPVGLAAWFGGPRVGVWVAVASGVGVWVEELLRVNPHWWCWNAVVRFGIYLAVVWVLAELRSALRERDRLLKRLRAAVADEREAREAAANLARDLARSNTELEQYASVAAHDLKSPLVVVGGFLQLLRRSVKGRLDPKEEGFIDEALNGVGYMETLVDDLLLYARVGAEDIGTEVAAADEALDRALVNLGPLIEASGAAVTRDALPSVRGNTSQLTQVFDNLLGNALKFRGEEPPRIHVGVERRGDEWIFSVRDNGIGIDPGRVDEIFRLFARLHGKSQYPGTGIGLSICKKIVERHGGRIWVGSEPGKGTTFCFSWPAAPPRDPPQGGHPNPAS